MVAAGALDLSAGKFAVALDVLIAMRAGEFEFAHDSNAYSKTRIDPNTNEEPANHANNAKEKDWFRVLWRL